MSHGFSYRQRLVLRDLLRQGPRTTDQLAAWWASKGRQPEPRREDGRCEEEETWTDYNRTAHYLARQALYDLEYEGVISNRMGKLSSPDCRGEPRWILTPYGERIARRIDDELGQAPAELLTSVERIFGDV